MGLGECLVAGSAAPPIFEFESVENTFDDIARPRDGSPKGFFRLRAEVLEMTAWSPVAFVLIGIISYLFAKYHPFAYSVVG